MPIYCYKSDNNEIVDRYFPMGEAPEKIALEDGTTARRDFQAEGVTGQMVGTDNPTHRSKPQRPWPMAPCVASGVHASQAAELRKHLADRDCPTEVTNDGDPIYTSAAHRKKALKIRGFTDRASFN
jgi:hypothetical protein